MGYSDSLKSMSTLAHELGHSMHSYLAWQTQPLAYGDYSLFVAEVASNFHQAMVRDYLLRTQTDRLHVMMVIARAGLMSEARIEGLIFAIESVARPDPVARLASGARGLRK